MVKILEPERTIDEEKVMRNNKELGSLNAADDIKNSHQLLPRIHLKALTYLIEEDIFVENVMAKAVAIRDEYLKKRKQKEKEKRNMKKTDVIVCCI